MALSEKAKSYIRNRRNRLCENTILGISANHSKSFKRNIKMRGYPFEASISPTEKDKATLEILKKW